jgi:hypothetical protein
MGGLRAGAETQTMTSTADGAAGPGERGSPPGPRNRWGPLSAYLLAGAILFVAYLRLSGTSQLNSDSANILLMAQDLLHGNLLLHGWYMSDVSFYPTEIPQYALLESFLGVKMQTAHVAAAMTYTLAFLFAVVLARSGASGRAAWTRTLIAAGIMLAPQLGLGVFALDLSVGHIGTSVPLLLLWLLLDCADPGGRNPDPPGTPRNRGALSPRIPHVYVPVLTAMVLAWVLMADQIVYLVGIAPLTLVCVIRVLRKTARGDGRWTQRVAGQWYELSLAAAAVVAAGLAWAAIRLVRDMGGYTMNKLPFFFLQPGRLNHNLPAAWKVLQIFGADYAGLGGIQLALALLHLASVIGVAAAVLLVAWRFFGEISLVDQVLAVAIVANVALFLLTNAAGLAAHEVAVIVPFGAALAARVLVPARTAQARTLRASRARLAALTAGAVVLAGYTAGFGYELTKPSVPPANVRLASWLPEHHLTYGLGGYWASSSVTVDSGQRVSVRALMQYTLKRDLWMAKSSWYDPKLHYANFVVLNAAPGFFSHWEPYGLIRKYFGVPARIYHTGTYTIMVWDKNLLSSIPR